MGRTPGQSLSSPGEFSRKVSDLTPDTGYEFRAVGEAGDTAATGEVRAFTTRPDPAAAQITTDNLTLFFEEQTELGTSTTTLETLRPDETWLAQVTPRDADDEAVASVTAETTIEGEPPDPLGGFRVTESELRVEDYPTEVSGTVENTRDEATSPEPIARVFDEAGRVVADSRTSMPEVPAGGTQRFAASFFRRAAARIRAEFDHEVILDESRG